VASVGKPAVRTKPDIGVEEVCDLMAEALKKKLRRIAPKQRETLVLALGATRLPVLAFDSVVTCFRERHRAIFERGLMSDKRATTTALGRQRSRRIEGV
jgi:hypothetical protein